MKNKTKLALKFFGALAFVTGMESASAALVVNPAQAITQLVTVQPIVVSDNGGANTAEFFGNAAQQLSIESLIDTIWAQAGIDVSFLAATSYNNTFANQGNSNPRPTSDLNTIVNDADVAGVTNANPNIINIFFVNVAAGFTTLSENSAAGLAFVGGNGITQYIGSNLLGFLGGREVIASVVAHEIGHNLGLPHITEAFNLMQAGGSADPGEILNGSQITTALNSNLSTPVTAVPLPSAIILLISGMGMFGFFGTRKRSL